MRKTWLLVVALVSACSRPDRPIASHPPETARTVTAQVDAASGGEVTRDVSAPYAGDLSIFENPNRAAVLGLDHVMERLRVVPGATVADVGAGSGWFTVRAARRVGPTGLVYAVEINDEYATKLEKRARDEQLANVRVVRGAIADPHLPERSIDAVLLLKTYHELAQPLAMARALRRALKPCGRLGVIDRGGKGGDHGLDEATVVSELTSTGFTCIERHHYGAAAQAERVEYFLVFSSAGCPP